VVKGGDELRRLSAAEVAGAVERGELSAVEVIEAHCAQLDALNPLNAIITGCADEALERARGGLTGRLAGVPVIVKDLIDTAGVRTTYGSCIFAEHVPARTAAAVRLLEDEGAVVIAKANLHEFAWGTTSQNPHWGYVGNPLHPGCVAGGSSGGNAAALAAGAGIIGLGTDTAGSIRIPSACCGTVGFKPAHGIVPSAGCFPLSPSFDVLGPMGRSVADCALAYSVLSGEPVPEPRLNGLAIGVLGDPPQVSSHDPGAPLGLVSPRIDTELDMLASLGGRLTDAHLEQPGADLVPLFLDEAARSHADMFPARRKEYGPDTQMKWDAAFAVPAQSVRAAERELPRWRMRVRSARGPDLYVSPTLAGPIPELDVWEPDVRLAMVGYTRIFSFLGWPAISIGRLQLAARDSATVLAAALAWEAAYGTTAVPVRRV
jgi:aspartyl-tRNA(Asn)/glutamyl-tRNA(Gln) amidotransferase subunit A